VLRAGTTRQQVLGLEVVLADGSVVTRMAGLPKDNVGYDLCSCRGQRGHSRRRHPGAPEGRSAARRAGRRARGPRRRAVGVALLVALRAGVAGLDAVEFLTADGLDLVLAAGRARAPFANARPSSCSPRRVGPDAGALTDALAAVVADCAGARDAAVGITDTDRARLWALREAHTEVLAPLRPVKLDVAVPVRALGGSWPACPAWWLVPAAGARSSSGTSPRATRTSTCSNVPPEREDGVTGAVLRLVASHGGSISAEHGVGPGQARLASPRALAGRPRGDARREGGARPGRTALARPGAARRLKSTPNIDPDRRC
jgi:FAD/FMN-containing dehydrogenase